MDESKIRCPCRKCYHITFEEAEIVRYHLCKFGFVPNYFEWNRHGEMSNRITEEIRTKCNDVRNSEDSKKKSELDKRNKRGVVLDGVAQSAHTTRSTPHAKVVIQLEQVELQREMLTQNGEDIDESQLYYDAVGGHDKKRRVYGLGSYGTFNRGPINVNTSDNITSTSQPLDNANSAKIQDEIENLNTSIRLVQQRLDALESERASTSSSHSSQLD